MFVFSVIIGLLAALGYASPLLIPHINSDQNDNSTTFKYAALGDSFASGIGAGLWVPDDVNNTIDGRNNICARMTKSYPYYVKESFSERVLTEFDFIACSGDVLDDIDEQVTMVNNTKKDFVSLSISGNDFGFGDVVRYCVYPFKGMTDAPSDFQKACDDRLSQAAAKIGDASIWARYREQIQLIQDKILLPSPTGHLYITGYARFFSPKGRDGDECDRKNFFSFCQWDIPCKWVFPLKMLWATRQKMNELVLEVNARIRTEVIEPLGGNSSGLHFIDVDPNFEGRRFCEPSKTIWGDNDGDVWFHHLFSELEELGDWYGPASPGAQFVANGTPQAKGMSLQELLSQTQPGGSPVDDIDLRWFWDKFQQSSVFHPKKYAHQVTAGNITARMAEDSFFSGAFRK